MKVSGNNLSCQLSGSITNQTKDNITSPYQSNLDIPSLLSFSLYYCPIWITRSMEAFAVGDNKQKQISSTLPNEILANDTKINLQYKNGQPCKFISAVSGYHYTLYQILSENSDTYQLAYAFYNEKTIFLNINKRSPMSLFGGQSTSAAIDSDGMLIIIPSNDFSKSEPKELSLPDGEKAIKVACGDTIFVLSQTGRVFRYSLETSDEPFVEVKELLGIKINEISGTRSHFFAISDDGRVFGLGSNENGKLGMPKDADHFEVIKSFGKHKVIEAFAGNRHSLFLTSEGKVLSCGFNYCGELMLGNPQTTSIHTPKETLITSNATFCISGSLVSAVFVGVEPPPNMPNMKIKPTDTSTGKDEITILKKMLESKEKEISSLKEKLMLIEKRNKELENKDKKSNTNDKEPKSSNPLDVLDQKTVDSLKKIKSLGRGATSEVFEVVREERLALKVYFPELIQKDEDDNEEEEKNAFDFDKMRRFLQEYEFLNSLNHPNIIKTFGISFSDPKHPPAILLEYCPSNLKKKIKKLNDNERICAIVDISSAMKEVHALGIIHRDLKLENILLDSNNKIKVSDFGLGTFIKLDSETISRTQMTGTLKYMAPELVQERDDYNEKVDVYAYGVVVFLILTKGEFPKISLHDVGNGWINSCGDLITLAL